MQAWRSKKNGKLLPVEPIEKTRLITDTDRVLCADVSGRDKLLHQLLRDHRRDAIRGADGKFGYTIRHLLDAINMEVGNLRVDEAPHVVITLDNKILTLF